MSSEVTVCIVAYNSALVLPDCLASIPLSCKIMLYDNASKDNSIDVALRLRPDTEVIRGDVNLGFGGGHNRLLSRVTTPFALVLNPDTVLSPLAISQFVNVAQLNPNAAIIGAAHTDGEGHIQPSHKADYTYYSRWARLHRPDLLPAHIKPIKYWPAIQGHACVDMVSGAAMFLRMSLFKGMGFFDPKIFLFFEDDDICARVRQAGFNVLYDSNILITHLGGQGARPSWRGTLFKQKHYAWSRLYMYRKYTSGYGHAPSLHSVMKKDAAKYLRRLLRAVFTFNQHGIAKNLGGLFGVLAYRQQPHRAP